MVSILLYWKFEISTVEIGNRFCPNLGFESFKAHCRRDKAMRLIASGVIAMMLGLIWAFHSASVSKVLGSNARISQNPNFCRDRCPGLQHRGGGHSIWQETQIKLGLSM
jgi:hypothetical protein